MANQQGNGRNVAMPDENRPSWRPQDDSNARNRRMMSDDDDRERMYRNDRDDDYLRDRERFGSYWDDRSSRSDRDEGYRTSDRYEDLPRDREGRNRSVGGGGYGHGEYRGGEYRGGDYRGGGYLGQSGQQMGGGSSYGDQSIGGSTGRYGHQEGGMYGHGAGSWGGYGNMGMESERSMHGMGYGSRTMADDFGPRGGTYGSPPVGAAQSGWNQQRMRNFDQQTRYGSQGYQGWGQEQDRQSHRGKGPSGYMRSDERIREMVCEALTEDHNVDASNIEVTVKSGDVTLAGTVDDRMQKRMAEDCVEQVAGVKDVQNQLRVGGDKKVSGKETELPANQDKRHRA